MILEAWKFDSEPIENQLEFEAPDFWLTLERADVAERTERPDSELIEDKAEIEKFKFVKPIMILKVYISGTIHIICQQKG